MKNHLCVAMALLALAGAAPARALELEQSMCHSDTPLISHATLAATQLALGRYRAIARAGGWPRLPMRSMQQGARGPEVRLLRLRLQAEGDLPAKGLGPEFDAGVAAGLKRFQQRYGLPVTGILDQYTLRTMNVPVEERIVFLESGLRELRQLPAGAFTADRQVTVNIPAAEVEAAEGGAVAELFRAAAGAPNRPSPDLSSEIVAVNFNPGWTVPPTIVREELIPKMQRDPAYLRRNGYEVLDANGRRVNPAHIDWHGSAPLRYSYRLPPGTHNPMGEIKLYLPNKQGVYMHDTPGRAVFGRGIRFLSSGCVRVQHIARLTAWLLGWSDSRVARTAAQDGTQNVRLGQPVPVRWVYVPAWSTPEKVTCFRPDVYHRVAVRAAVL